MRGYSPQSREQLVAHRVLEAAPAALVVRSLVVQRVDAVAQLGPGQVSLGDERRLARREAHHWRVSVELDGDGVRADDAPNVVLALRLEPEEAESPSVRRRALRDLADLQHRGADRRSIHVRHHIERALELGLFLLCAHAAGWVLEERGVVPKHALDVRALRERRAQQLEPRAMRIGITGGQPAMSERADAPRGSLHERDRLVGREEGGLALERLELLPPSQARLGGLPQPRGAQELDVLTAQRLDEPLVEPGELAQDLGRGGRARRHSSREGDRRAIAMRTTQDGARLLAAVNARRAPTASQAHCKEK